MQGMELTQLIARYHAASFAVTKQVETEIRTQLRGDLTLEQYAILHHIRMRGSCMSTELADIFHVGKSAITSLITKLTDKDMLRRVPDPNDRRIIRLELTDTGREISLKTDQCIEQWLASYLVHFSRDEIYDFILAFEKLARLVTKQDEGSGDQDENNH